MFGVDSVLTGYDLSIETLKNIPKGIRVCIMAHNSNWSEIEKHRVACQCTFDIFGSSISYFQLFKKSKKIDYDLILLYGNDFFDDEVLKEIKEIATNISSSEEKLVVYGYSSFIPVNERVNNISYKLIIGTANNGELEKEETVIPITKADPNGIIPFLVAMYKEINENIIVKELKNKKTSTI